MVSALGGVWLTRTVVDPNGGAKQVAVTYTYARLTHNYSTWWDNAAPECRPQSTKDQWIADIRSGFQSLGTTGESTDTKVQAAGVRSVGGLRKVHVRITPPARPTADVEVDVQQVNGTWFVVGYGPPGEADHCAVF